jgi:D-alanyl-D-alanine dipeptidase
MLAPARGRGNDVIWLFALFLVLNVLPGAAAAKEPALPAGFVHLRDVAPTIVQDMRYAGTFNFTGARVPGYRAAECILWRPAAEALARAQERLKAEGLLLKVYDCYRPVQAVRAFAAWSRGAGGDTMKPIFYPAFDKSQLFALGYIASKSHHSLGIAVDIGLIAASDADLPAPTKAGACDGPFAERANESSLDFGTAFDCFSPLSATRNPSISGKARANRDRLVRALAAEGFRNYPKEWWHFDYSRGSVPTKPRDFPVE